MKRVKLKEMDWGTGFDPKDLLEAYGTIVEMNLLEGRRRSILFRAQTTNGYVLALELDVCFTLESCKMRWYPDIVPFLIDLWIMDETRIKKCIALLTNKHVLGKDMTRLLCKHVLTLPAP